jgi:regulator of sigma E protease
MNILPIPALDGGHVVFLLTEMILRRPLSEKFLERAQYVGMIILLTLMVLIFGNDLFGLFF